MNIAEVIVRYLEDLGIKHIFCIPGGPLTPMTEAIWKSRKLKLVCTSHEEGAAFMAHGYAWISGTLGVCCFTTGPGAINALTGVATAKLERTPLLVLTAMNALKNFSKKNAQDSKPYEGVDTVGIYEKVTYYSRTIYHPGEVHLVIQNAIKIALLKQGPVHVSIPTDIGFQEVPAKSPIYQPYQYIPTMPKIPSEKEIAVAAEELARAEQPLLFVGHGAVTCRAFSEVKKLAETLSIPVITTANAKGAFPESHPLSLGVYGFSSSCHALEYVKNRHDVMLSAGVNFHENDTENWAEALMPTKTMIQMDTDPLNYGCYYPGSMSLIGDAKEILARINHLLGTYPVSRQETSKRLESIVQFKDKFSRFQEPEKLFSDALPLKAQRLMKDIEGSFPEETVYVADVGGAFCWSTHFLTLSRPLTFLPSIYSASMGFSISAIGCKCARPEYPVVAIVGDGAMRMNGMEIATAVNNTLPVIFIILNNAQWGMVHFGNKLTGQKADIADFKEIDFVKIADGLGAKGVKITKPGEINKELVRTFIQAQQTVVLDVAIDPNECPPFGNRIREIKSQIQGS